MRKMLVVLLLVFASAALAKDVEFEEFRAGIATAHAVRALGYERLDPQMFDAVVLTARAERSGDFSARGAEVLDAGTYDVPVMAVLPRDDAVLVRTLAITSGDEAGAGYGRLQCWLTAF